MPSPARVLGAVREHGVAGTAQRVAARVRPPAPIDAKIVWYVMDLEAPVTTDRQLPEGMSMRRASREDVPLLEQLPPHPAISTIDAAELETRLAGGGTLWIVTEGDRTAFACWTFRGRAPMFAAPGGMMDLPERTVLLEDSISSPDFRGRGVAPGAWSTLRDALRADGQHALITKVGTDNIPSRRAVEKVGFRDVGRMHVKRRAWFTRVRIGLTEQSPDTLWLKSLERN